MRALSLCAVLVTLTSCAPEGKPLGNGCVNEALSLEQAASDLFRARGAIGHQLAATSPTEIAGRSRVVEPARANADCLTRASASYTLGDVEYRVIRVYFNGSVFSDYAYFVYVDGSTSAALSGTVTVE